MNNKIFNSCCIIITISLVWCIFNFPKDLKRGIIPEFDNRVSEMKRYQDKKNEIIMAMLMAVPEISKEIKCKH